MVLHIPLSYHHGRDSALGVQGPCPQAGGLGGPSAPPGKQGGVGGCKPPTCYRVKVLHGTQPCIPIVSFVHATRHILEHRTNIFWQDQLISVWFHVASCAVSAD